MLYYCEYFFCANEDSKKSKNSDPKPGDRAAWNYAVWWSEFHIPHPTFRIPTHIPIYTPIHTPICIPNFILNSILNSIVDSILNSMPNLILNSILTSFLHSILNSPFSFLLSRIYYPFSMLYIMIHSIFSIPHCTFNSSLFIPFPNQSPFHTPSSLPYPLPCTLVRYEIAIPGVQVIWTVWHRICHFFNFNPNKYLAIFTPIL